MAVGKRMRAGVMAMAVLVMLASPAAQANTERSSGGAAIAAGSISVGGVSSPPAMESPGMSAAGMSSTVSAGGDVGGPGSLGGSLAAGHEMSRAARAFGFSGLAGYGASN